MLKTRLIPVLYIMNGHIVRSEGFSVHQRIGNVVSEAKRYNEWNVDELIYIDISREEGYDLGRDDHRVAAYHSIEEIMSEISSVCFMPLTFGGGIRSMDKIDFFIRNGADKVILNTGAFHDHDLVKNAAAKYGSQAVVISMDYRMSGGVPLVHTHYGTHDTGMNIYEWIRISEDLGAGEIFLNSIDRDGKGNGYDIEVIAKAVQITNLPVVACGGAGEIKDFYELGRQTEVSGIAAGNIFHFTERSYPRAKVYLKKEGLHVR